MTYLTLAPSCTKGKAKILYIYPQFDSSFGFSTLVVENESLVNFFRRIRIGRHPLWIALISIRLRYVQYMVMNELIAIIYILLFHYDFESEESEGSYCA